MLIFLILSICISQKCIKSFVLIFASTALWDDGERSQFSTVNYCNSGAAVYFVFAQAVPFQFSFNCVFTPFHGIILDRSQCNPLSMTMVECTKVDQSPRFRVFILVIDLFPEVNIMDQTETTSVTASASKACCSAS